MIVRPQNHDPAFRCDVISSGVEIRP